MSPAAVRVDRLEKTLGPNKVLRGISFEAQPGEIFGLLGPNGAGKTTTLRMVTGLLAPDRGSIRVFGIDALTDPVGAKQIIAWLSDEPMIYDKLLRGKQDENTYCLTGECSRDVKRCLTKHAPVASLVLRPSRSSPSNS